MTGGSTIGLRSLQLRMPNARYPTRPPVECTVKLLCLNRQIGKPSDICRGFLFQAPSHSMCTLSPPLLHPHKGPPASSFYANLCARSAFTKKDAKFRKHNHQAAVQSEFWYLGGGLKSWGVSGTPQSAANTHQTSYSSCSQTHLIHCFGQMLRMQAMLLLLTEFQQRNLPSCLIGWGWGTGCGVGMGTGTPMLQATLLSR